MQNCCTFVCKIKKNTSFYQKKRLIVCEIIFISYFCSRKKYLITLKQRQIRIMHSLYFGGGVAQDSKSREAVSPTHYFI